MQQQQQQQVAGRRLVLQQQQQQNPNQLRQILLNQVFQHYSRQRIVGVIVYHDNPIGTICLLTERCEIILSATTF